MARIQNNMMAMNTHRQYTINNANAAASAEKLSSGYRINRAGDDAAGLAISEKMRAQIRGLNMASNNSQNAISLVQTAEGALTEVHSMLQRMNELADQSATGTNEAFDRQAISAEFSALKSEIDDIANQTTFNNMKLFDGTLESIVTTPGTLATAGSFKLTIGGTFAADDLLTLTFGVGETLTHTFLAGSVTATDAAAAMVADGPITIGGTEYQITNSGAELTFTATDAGASDVTSITVVASGGTTPTATIASRVDGEAAVPDVSTGGIMIQVGANDGETLNLSIKQLDTEGLGIALSTIDNQLNASAALGKGDDGTGNATGLKAAINMVSEQRATLGAMQNRLQHKINNLNTSAENLQSAESRIRDVDMAQEMSNFTKQNILSQAATAMLAQANAAPQNVLQLLQ